MRPLRIVVLSFLAFIFLGAVLLTLPAASANGHSIGFLNALFESTSAVCVTGLVVVDTGTELTNFGQMVLLVLIQIGGLGVMVAASAFFVMIGGKLRLSDKLVVRDSLNQNSYGGTKKLLKATFVITAVTELLGTMLLAIRFIPQFGLKTGIYYSVFHSVSAFCNSGFDLMGGYRSFMGSVSDPLINFTVMGLITIGGFGCVVIADIIKKRLKIKRFSLHTKIVLSVSFVLSFGGALLFAVLEWTNPGTLGPLHPATKLMASLFHSVALRTAGFNTIDLVPLTDASKLISVILMFIGASPASTGGGIKTVTFFVIILSMFCEVTSKSELNVFNRSIYKEAVRRASVIMGFSLSVLIFNTLLLSIFENINFIDILFEVSSALGTVGDATLNTGTLKAASKIVLIITMFLGRIGPVSIAVALYSVGRRSKGVKPKTLTYAEENVLLG